MCMDFNKLRRLLQVAARSGCQRGSDLRIFILRALGERLWRGLNNRMTNRLPSCLG